MSSRSLLLPRFLVLFPLVFPILPGRAAPPAEVAEIVEKESDWERLEEGDVILLERSFPDDQKKGDAAKDEQHGAIAAILIDSPPKAVWDVIADKEAAPDYIDSLESAKIIEENGDHVLIRQVMKLGPLPKVTYVVKHCPIPPHTVNFERHSGDLEDIQGFWKFLPVDDGRKCLVIYKLSLEPGFLVPNFVIRRSLKKSLPDALRAVRDEVKKRARD